MIEIGAVLGGKYRVLAKLGEGGMGAVFRAENQVTGKLVAIKCMHPQVRNSSSASERLLREARAASSLSHPNVVDVYDVLQDGEHVFLVMQLLHGETLKDFLNRESQPRISEFVSLLLPAISGVAAAHERGVIHRDLKPDNIFLEQMTGSPHGVAKVLDFGIAKLAGTQGQTLTQTGMALGTPLYMSLEQLRGDKDVDGRVDVYAFGVMLYQAVTGQMPFEAATLPELAIKVATTDARPVKSLRPDVPTSLANIIDWAVARNRDARLPDLQTLKRELAVFARDHSFRDQMTHHEAAIPLLRAAGSERSSGSAAPQRPSERPSDPAPPADSNQFAVADTMRAREIMRRKSASRRRPLWLLGAAGTAGLALIVLQPWAAEAPSSEEHASESAVQPALTGEPAAAASDSPAAAKASASATQGESAAQRGHDGTRGSQQAESAPSNPAAASQSAAANPAAASQQAERAASNPAAASQSANSAAVNPAAASQQAERSASNPAAASQSANSAASNPAASRSASNPPAASQAANSAASNPPASQQAERAAASQSANGTASNSPAASQSANRAETPGMQPQAANPAARGAAAPSTPALQPVGKPATPNGSAEQPSKVASDGASNANTQRNAAAAPATGKPTSSDSAAKPNVAATPAKPTQAAAPLTAATQPKPVQPSAATTPTLNAAAAKEKVEAPLRAAQQQPPAVQPVRVATPTQPAPAKKKTSAELIGF
jgi:eukaryotic-like serine/threonine-protein kinase